MASSASIPAWSIAFDGAQRVDDGPAEVVVDFQTVECHGTVEQALRVGDERLVARLAVAQVGGDELELFVGAAWPDPPA